MNVQTAPMDNPLRIRPIRMGWELSVEPYPNWLFGSIVNLDPLFGNSSVETQTQTRIGTPEPLLVFAWTDNKYMVLWGYFKSQ